MLKSTFRPWLCSILALAAAFNLAACGGGDDPVTPPGPGPGPGPTPAVELEIAFTQPGTFYLGETKTIDYTLPKDQPSSITAGTAAGWTVEVNTATRKITVTCAEDCPEASKNATVTLTMTAEAKTATASLNLATNLAVNFANGVEAADDWGGGDGTAASPWEI